MAHKPLVNSTVREIGKGKAMIGGTVREVSHGNALVNGTVYKAGFSTPIGSLPVGTSVYFTINNTRTRCIIVHQGRPSSMYDTSCDGTWVLMHNAFISAAFHGENSNSYIQSVPYLFLRDTMPQAIEPNVRNAIKTAKIPYVHGNGNGYVLSGANGLASPCFILSAYEVGFTQANNGHLPIDGAVLDYFKAGASRVTYLNGGVVNWWFRSPAMGFANMMFIGNTSGGLDVLYCNYAAAIRFAFILSPDFDATNYL